MERDIAIRLDALLVNAIENINLIAGFMKKNLTEADFDENIKNLGPPMSILIDYSEQLRNGHPDIVTNNFRRDV